MVLLKSILPPITEARNLKYHLMGVLVMRGRIPTWNSLDVNYTVDIDSKMPSRPKETPKPSWVANQGYQMSLFSENPRTYDRAQDVHIEEIKTTPLFSAAVLASASKADLTSNDIFPQYGLLAKRLGTYHAGKSNSVDGFENPGKSGLDPSDQRLFLNMNAPWSAFICGSQGSGKSHTLSCMLEMALIPSKLGELPRPLAAIVFHYDKFTGVPSSQVCEAAHLCSSGIPVRVLVSESNLLKMKELYSNLPGLSASAIKPVVMPLLLNEKQLNAERMMKLMAVDEKERAMPLYMEVRSKKVCFSKAIAINYTEAVLDRYQNRTNVA